MWWATSRCDRVVVGVERLQDVADEVTHQADVVAGIGIVAGCMGGRREVVFVGDAVDGRAALALAVVDVIVLAVGVVRGLDRVGIVAGEPRDLGVEPAIDPAVEHLQRLVDDPVTGTVAVTAAVPPARTGPP